jgi:hypothetical protein
MLTSAAETLFVFVLMLLPLARRPQSFLVH